MREIKFRAWHATAGKMYVWEGDGNDYKDEWWGDDWTVFWGAIRNVAKHYTLMQFTGLEDKNGNEIYEGDIVKWGHHCEFCHEDPIRIAETTISPDIQFVTDKYTFHFGNFAYKDTEKHLEVIGNIYEHPELLDPKVGTEINS